MKMKQRHGDEPLSRSLSKAHCSRLIGNQNGLSE
jgi:hypothetical protein